MTKIIVDVNKLMEYGTQLEENATELDAILKNMKGIVESLSSGWDGVDSRNFIENATSYINNLQAVRDALNGAANVVKNYAVSYNNRIAEFYSIIGG